MMAPLNTNFLPNMDTLEIRLGDQRLVWRDGRPVLEPIEPDIQKQDETGNGNEPAPFQQSPAATVMWIGAGIVGLAILGTLARGR